MKSCNIYGYHGNLLFILLLWNNRGPSRNKELKKKNNTEQWWHSLYVFCFLCGTTDIHRRSPETHRQHGGWALPIISCQAEAGAPVRTLISGCPQSGHLGWIMRFLRYRADNLKKGSSETSPACLVSWTHAYAFSGGVTSLLARNCAQPLNWVTLWVQALHFA